MAKKITELPTATSVDSTDRLVLVDMPGQTTKQATVEQLFTSPVLKGTPTYEGERLTIYSEVGEVQTSSTSPATVVEFTLTDETYCQFDALVTFARRTNVTKAGSYKLSVGYLRTGGAAPTIVGSLVSQTEQETTAGDTATIDVSGNNVRVRVTAADSDPRNWSCELRVQETTAV